MQIILTVFPLFSHQYPPWALMKTKKFFLVKIRSNRGCSPAAPAAFLTSAIQLTEIRQAYLCSFPI